LEIEKEYQFSSQL